MSNYEEKEKWQMRDIISAVADRYKIPESEIKKYKDRFRTKITRKLQELPNQANSYWKQYEVLKKKSNPKVDEDPNQKEHFIPKEIAEYIYKDVMYDYFKAFSSDDAIKYSVPEEKIDEMREKFIEEKNERDIKRQEEIRDESVNYELGSEENVQKIYMKTMIEAIFQKFYTPIDIDKLREDDKVVSGGMDYNEIDSKFFESLERIENPHKYYYFEKEDNIHDLMDEFAEKIAEKIVIKLNKK